jgi:hypothetical protein
VSLRIKTETDLRISQKIAQSNSDKVRFESLLIGNIKLEIKADFKSKLNQRGAVKGIKQIKQQFEIVGRFIRREVLEDNRFVTVKLKIRKLKQSTETLIK